MWVYCEVSCNDQTCHIFAGHLNRTSIGPAGFNHAEIQWSYITRFRVDERFCTFGLLFKKLILLELHSLDSTSFFYIEVDRVTADQAFQY